jgi:hypothetical protein
MSRDLPFAKLKELLVGLGFDCRATPGSSVVFRHRPSRALIVLRFYQDDEALSPTDLAVAGRVLDEFGVMPREKFEAAVRERAQAG